MFALIVSYFLLSASIKLLFSIDIMIPCLIESISGYHCPGCGLSTAFLNLVKLNITEAWESNPLIFAIVPLGTWFVLTDFIRFRKSSS